MTEASRSEYVLLLSRSLVIPDHDDRLRHREMLHKGINLRLDCLQALADDLDVPRLLIGTLHLANVAAMALAAVQLLHDFIHEITLAAASRADCTWRTFNAGGEAACVERRAAPAGSHDVDRTEFAVWLTLLLLSTAVLVPQQDLVRLEEENARSGPARAELFARGSDIVLFVLKDGGLGHLDFPRGGRLHRQSNLLGHHRTKVEVLDLYGLCERESVWCRTPDTLLSDSQSSALAYLPV